MTKELKFLQQIVKAYDHKDSTHSLTAFFNQTDRLKMDSPFVIFMKECLAYRDSFAENSPGGRVLLTLQRPFQARPCYET